MTANYFPLSSMTLLKLNGCNDMSDSSIDKITEKHGERYVTFTLLFLILINIERESQNINILCKGKSLFREYR